MTTTTVFVRIEYDHKLTMEEAESLFHGVKDGLGEKPVDGFHFECTYNDEDEETHQEQESRK